MGIIDFLNSGLLQSGVVITTIGPWLVVIGGFTAIAVFALRRSRRQ